MLSLVRPSVAWKNPFENLEGVFKQKGPIWSRSCIVVLRMSTMINNLMFDKKVTSFLKMLMMYCFIFQYQNGRNAIEEDVVFIETGSRKQSLH